MVYCTRDELRERNWDALRRLRELEDAGQLGPGPGISPVAPAAGAASVESEERSGGWKDLDQVHDQLAVQHDSTVDRRRKWQAKQADLEVVGDEGLKADAEKKVQRLGVREYVMDPSQNVAAAMLAQKGEAADRTRVTSKSAATRGRGRSRGLLHHAAPTAVASTSGLGPGRTVMHRASERGNGSRVIA